MGSSSSPHSTVVQRSFHRARDGRERAGARRQAGQCVAGVGAPRRARERQSARHLHGHHAGHHLVERLLVPRVFRRRQARAVGAASEQQDGAVAAQPRDERRADVSQLARNDVSRLQQGTAESGGIARPIGENRRHGPSCERSMSGGRERCHRLALTRL